MVSRGGRVRRGGARSAGARRAESGMALVGALVVLLLMAGALALLASSLELKLRTVRTEARTVRLTALADAAVSATVAELARDWSFPGVSERGFGGGTIASDVEALDSARSAVVARAVYGGREKTVRVTVTRTIEGLRIAGWRRLSGGPVGGVP